MSDFRQELLEAMQEIRTIDCHSHTCLKSQYYKAGQRNLFNLMSYYEREINSVTGKSSDEIYAEAKSDAERWEILKPIIDCTRNESYWRHNIVMYREVFGLKDEDLNDDNWENLNEAIKLKSTEPDWYHNITKNVCNIATQIRNIPWFQDWEPEYFTAVLRMEGALELHRKNMRESLEKYLDRSFDSLSSLKEGLADLVERYQKRGSVGIKLAHAYGRTLASDDVPDDIASNIFAKALGGGSLSSQEIKQFQDNIIFFLARLAGEMNQVFQIHTGVQGNWGVIPNSNPLHLIPLIHANKNTRFDLFHAGYPYSREMGMLGKHAPNVWLNMCWMYVITMEGSRQSLSEWIDLVPGHRILGFGSDVGWPEFIYAHLVMARSCIADILAQKVERDFLSKEVALDLVKKMLRDNAIKLYGLPEDI
ncbi:amidohydrolase family protein [Candidatus Poribacteria bacterium]|nr:amidohydrolase family protein [Candidatus Poribacteria bacterium]